MAALSPRRARDALAKRLQELRKAEHPQGAEFAAKLAKLGTGWGQSKVSRIETGKQAPTVADLQAWAAVTGANLEELLMLHQRAESERDTFAARYRDSGSAADFQAAIGAAEQASTRIGEYQPALVPGLLQTADYAREMLRLPGGPATFGATDDDISGMIAARLRRQAILYEPGRQIIMVMSEAALRIQVASPAVMRGQCEHVARLAETLTTATIGVVPFFTQVPVAAITGWAILDNLVTVETESVPLELADPAEATRYWQHTEALLAVAATGTQAAALCRRIATEFGES